MQKRQFIFKIDSNTERIQQFIEYQAEVATRIYWFANPIKTLSYNPSLNCYFKLARLKLAN